MIKENVSNLGLILFLVLCINFGACKKDKLGISQNSLSGHWLEVEPASIIQFAGTNHEFYFNDDKTFTLKKEYWTDIITSDPCFAHHVDYVVGTYSYTNSQFIFTGKYSNAQFSVLQPNICGQTDYTFTSHYNFNNGILTLNSNQDLYYQIALRKQ